MSKSDDKNTSYKGSEQQSQDLATDMRSGNVPSSSQSWQTPLSRNQSIDWLEWTLARSRTELNSYQSRAYDRAKKSIDYNSASHYKIYNYGTDLNTLAKASSLHPILRSQNDTQRNKLYERLSSDKSEAFKAELIGWCESLKMETGEDLSEYQPTWRSDA